MGLDPSGRWRTLARLGSWTSLIASWCGCAPAADFPPGSFELFSLTGAPAARQIIDLFYLVTMV